MTKYERYKVEFEFFVPEDSWESDASIHSALSAAMDNWGWHPVYVIVTQQ